MVFENGVKIYKPRLIMVRVQYIKFIYSEKSTKFCEISTVDLSYVVPVKSMAEISQNFVAFSEYFRDFNFQGVLRPYLQRSTA